jgi:hypothetical protein
LTPAQIKNIHIAKSHVHLADEQYRLLLANVSGVSSSKQLTQAQYEDCMAVLEDMGYQQIIDGQPAAPNYWRQKVATRATKANARLINKICTLYQEYLTASALHGETRGVAGSPTDPPRLEARIYDLAGLVRRVSQDRTPVPDQLTPREALNLIESLKAILARGTAIPGGDSSPTESPAPQSPPDHTSVSSVLSVSSVSTPEDPS